MRMPQNRLDLGQREPLVTSHPGGGGVARVMQSPVRAQLVVRPLQDPAHRPVRQWPGLTAPGSPDRLARRGKAVGGQIATEVTESVRRGAGAGCLSRVPLLIT